MPRHLLVYDSDCGPCTRFKRAIGFLDVHREFSFMSLTRADLDGYLDGIRPSVRHRSFHLLTPDGRILSGAKALPTLVRLLPTGALLSKAITTAPGGLRATAFVYEVASRRHDSGSCRYKPGQAVVHQIGSEAFSLHPALPN